MLQIFHDEAQIVRLGQGFGQSVEKNFHPEAILRADLCLKNFKVVIDRHKPEKILAMATSAARDAINKEELFRLGHKYEIPIEIIPGNREAEITYQGATSGINNPNYILVVDIGGGSTEFIIGKDAKINLAKSFDIGCVRLTEKFIIEQPTPPDQIFKAEKEIRKNLKDFKNQINMLSQFDILAVAGTPTSLVAAQIGEFSPEKIDGFVLTEQNLLNWKDKLTKATVDEKIKMGIPAGRADVILIGVLTLLETLKAFNKTKLTVSTRGVRHGVALEMYRRFHS